jgi:hypothetical protein
MSIEIPILYSTEMVKAQVEGRKSMTRRIVKCDKVTEFPEEWIYRKFGGMAIDPYTDWHHQFLNDFGRIYSEVKCPYGKPGDLHWVKETFTVLEYEASTKMVHVMYEDAKTMLCTLNDTEWSKFEKWQEKTVRKSSLFLFKSMSRIWNKVKNVRCERLHNISEADILAEGVRIPVNGIGTNKVLLRIGEANTALSFLPDGCLLPDAPRLTQYQLLFAHMAELWCEINSRESWDANPWLWVIEFEIKSTTGKPSSF